MQLYVGCDRLWNEWVWGTAGMSIGHCWNDTERGKLKYSEKNMCFTYPTCINLESNTNILGNSLAGNRLSHGILRLSVVAYVFIIVFPPRIIPYIFPSITSFRRQFLRKMLSIQLKFLIFIVYYSILNCSLFIIAY
jgi:hypothetical protein